MTSTPPLGELNLSAPQRDQIATVLNSAATPTHKWQQVIEQLPRDSTNPGIYRSLWEAIFSEVDFEPGPPMWLPERRVVERSNINHWCRELGLSGFSDLHRWSIDERAAFWDQTVQRLGIRFSTREGPILHPVDDAARAVWFPEAQLNIVESCFLADPDAVAIIAQAPGGPLRKTTYRELKHQTARVARSIEKAGFVPGDRIAVVLPMTPWSVALYLGIVAAGCSVVSIADSFAAPEIATRLRIANASCVITYDVLSRSGKQLPLYERVKASTDLPVIVLNASNDTQVDLRTQDQQWQSFIVAEADLKPVVSRSNDCINVLFSSGTTGDPKAIVWNHLTPIRCAVDGHVHHDLQPGDVAAWPTNLGWMMGPWLIFASLINRATIALFEDAPMTMEFGKFVEEAGVSMLGVVPTLVRNWRKSQTMEKLDWSNIKVFSSTGETSQPSDMFYLSSLAGMKPIIEYCGGTEIGGGYITSTVVEPNVPSAFTTPAIGLDFVLLDPQGEPADEGEVFLFPPSVGLSNELLNRDHYETYYEGTPPGPEGATLRRHGDYFKKIGDYYVAGGRIDDTMNLGGIKVSSAELERVLNPVPGVRETAAVAVTDDGGPDRLVVFAVPDEGIGPELDSPGLIAEMNSRLKAELNPLFKVSQIELVDALPRTASNKVMRRKLRDQIAPTS